MANCNCMGGPNCCRLSPKDSLIFAKSIIDPPEPNEKLKALFAKDNEEILRDLEPKEGDKMKDNEGTWYFEDGQWWLM